MTSVAPAAAEQPPIFHAEAERTPLQAVVASELGEGLASSGFLVLPSQLEGFVQVGAPVVEHEVADFGTSRKPCPTAVTVRTVPGELATTDAAPMLCPCCGGAMERHGEAKVTLYNVVQNCATQRLKSVPWAYVEPTLTCRLCESRQRD